MKNTITCLCILCVVCSASIGSDLYNLDTPLESRSICFENVTGEPHVGGQAASHLGGGRKGAPAKAIPAGRSEILCNISGPGTIRHIWMTGGFRTPAVLRKLVLRAWWDGQKHPSIECPLGDFFGLAHSKVTSYQSAVHSIGRNAALNIWLAMPFVKGARITLTNEHDKDVMLYYQIDYTINDTHPDNVGRLHCLFRRENPTNLKEDFTVLPQRQGKGCFVGCLLGIRTLEGNWWGEGEIKIFMDGDETFPTICGTGSEDYVCLSYGMQDTPFLYHGCNLNKDGLISMYRWHLPDPIYWKKECRITIQQIGWSKEKSGTPNSGLYERQDDWSCATFWYESVPSAPLAPLPGLATRTADMVATD